jgi:hypothetical protein
MLANVLTASPMLASIKLGDQGRNQYSTLPLWLVKAITIINVAAHAPATEDFMLVEGVRSQCKLGYFPTATVNFSF